LARQSQSKTLRRRSGMPSRSRRIRARILVGKGRVSYRAGRLREAARLFREATTVDGTLADGFFNLGVVYIDQGQPRAAERALKSGLALRKTAPAFTMLGALQRRRDALTEAQENFERSLALDPDDDEAHFGLALVLSSTEPDKALRHFRIASRLDPTYEGLHREMGKVLWRLGRMREAERAFRKAVRLYGDDPWAHSYLGSILTHRESWREALRAFLAAVELFPRWPLFWADVGMAYAKLDQSMNADLAFRRALALDITDLTSNLRYGQFLMQLGRRAKAERFLKRALRKDPTNATAQRALDSLRRAQGT
jgi:tetratricopeptide (TPR) repeat protein